MTKREGQGDGTEVEVGFVDRILRHFQKASRYGLEVIFVRLQEYKE